jgi:hypothetical protein
VNIAQEIRAALSAVRVRLEAVVLRQKWLVNGRRPNSTPTLPDSKSESKSDSKWLSVKEAIRVHHLDAKRESRIGIIAALENPIRRNY